MKIIKYVISYNINKNITSHFSTFSTNLKNK